MSFLQDMVDGVRKRLRTFRAISIYRKYRTNMTPAVAAAHFSYHQKARTTFDARLLAGVEPEIRQAALSFNELGVASFSGPDTVSAAGQMIAVLKHEEARGLAIWDETGELREDPFKKFPQLQTVLCGTFARFIRSVYGSEFKIYYAKLFKVQRDSEAPSGSQLWHVDGGPGTCINVLFYLDDTRKENGALECVPWRVTQKLMEDFEIKGGLAKARDSLSKLDYRAFKAAKCEEVIRGRYPGQIIQPEGPGGLMVAFRNNLFHRGGYPDPGKVRYALVLHVYPSDKPLDIATLVERGSKKYGSYPEDPGF